MNRIQGDASPSFVSPNPDWQHNISTSFSQLALQFQAAAQALAAMPPSSEQLIGLLLERLESIEERQRKLAQDIETLKASLNQPVVVQAPQPPAANGDSTSHLEEALKAQLEAFKLEQERLPARLHNALATKSLSSIKMPPLKSRKPPINSPNTRGEFEHLTKERYEAILLSYDIPPSGDTNSKRELLRAFLGIPATPLK